MKWRTLIPAVMAILLMAFGIFAFRAQAQPPYPLLGKTAPRLSGRAAFGKGLLTLDKIRQDLVPERDAQGKPIKEGGRYKVRVQKNVVVLNFFATYCAPCIKEIPTYNRLAQTWKDRPVKFVYVNVDTEKSSGEVRSFAKQKGISVEMIMPSVRYVIQTYHIDALPKLLVIDTEGTVVYVISGFQKDLTRQLEAVLSRLVKKSSSPG